MRFSKVLIPLISAFSLSVMIPTHGYCQEDEITVNPLLQSLKEGKATLSTDKKNILDESGKIVASLLPAPLKKGNLPAEKGVPICNPACAIVEQQCYVDMRGSIVCINVCKKELFTCN